MLTLLAVFSSIGGFFWAGLAIASLHKYAHAGKMTTEAGPTTAMIYVRMHLAHHASTSPRFTLNLFNLPRKEWLRQIVESFSFALKDNRWVAHRTIFVYRSLQILGILLLMTLCSELTWIGAMFGSLLFLTSTFACLMWYELCHAWTHSGGPYPSALHAAHHLHPNRDFGMWTWQNSFGDFAMHNTINGIRHAEIIFNHIPVLKRLTQTSH